MNGMCREGVGLDRSRRFPAVQDRQAHVHQDDVGELDLGHRHALGAIDGHDDHVAPSFETPRQHVAVHLVVLHDQDLRYRT